MYGLLQRDLDYLRQTLAVFTQVKQALLFGSRAVRSYKKGSDIDMVLGGRELGSALVVQISSKLNEEVPIPYFVDVIDLRAIKNKNTATYRWRGDLPTRGRGQRIAPAGSPRGQSAIPMTSSIMHPVTNIKNRVSSIKFYVPNSNHRQRSIFKLLTENR